MAGLMRALMAMAAALTLAACASNTPQARSESDTNYLAQQRAITDSGPLGLLADACVIRDEIGNDFVVVGASEGMPLRPALALRSLLMERGQTVPNATVKTVCAATDAQTDTLPWAESRAHEPQAAPARTTIARSATQERAAKLQRAVFQAISKSSGGYRLRALDLSKSDASELQQDLGAKRVWAIQLAGIDVSTGKRVGQSLGYAFLSYPFVFVEPLAAEAMAGADDDLQRYTLALVDLEARQLVWWKASNWADPGSHFGAAYGVDWAYRATSPLYR
ncbi:hypothetical protein GYB61_02515 [bacterium]|nr:hypothetical protein [bacterium]